MCTRQCVLDTSDHSPWILSSEYSLTSAPNRLKLKTIHAKSFFPLSLPRTETPLFVIPLYSMYSLKTLLVKSIHWRAFTELTVHSGRIGRADSNGRLICWKSPLHISIASRSRWTMAQASHCSMLKTFESKGLCSSASRTIHRIVVWGPMRFNLQSTGQFSVSSKPDPVWRFTLTAPFPQETVYTPWFSLDIAYLKKGTRVIEVALVNTLRWKLPTVRLASKF